MAGTLIQHLHFPAFAARRKGPAAPTERFHREDGGSTVEEELSQGGSRDAFKGCAVGLAGHRHLVALDLDLDYLAIQQDPVSHWGSITATDSTWVVWGKRSKACTRWRRNRPRRPRSRARVAGSQEMY